MKKSTILLGVGFSIIILILIYEMFLPKGGNSILKNTNSKIVGGVVPHHQVADFMIDDFFKHLALQKPQTLILLGPNHTEKGDFKILTSLNDWPTSLGSVLPDKIFINQLLTKNLAEQNEAVLTHDQALTGVIPSIKKYLPKTKIVPLLLSRNLTAEESRVLAQNIASLSGKDDIFVTSVDFSHYLPLLTAEENDKISLATIKDFDYQKLFQMNSDYLDSPPAIGVLLYIMQEKGAGEIQLLKHSNSALIQKSHEDFTTSYFTLLFKSSK